MGHISFKHTHTPDVLNTFYAYCTGCNQPITCAPKDGLYASKTWRIDHSNRGRILRGPRWH